MNDVAPLDLGHHQATYDALFQHPIAHNLQWRDLNALLTAVADTAEEHNGKMKFVRNGQTLVVHPPRHKDFSDSEELMAVRRFLERSAAPSPATTGDALHLLVVIDHREARIFRSELHGTTPERIAPFDPHGSGRYLHQVELDTSGQRKPELKSFYEAVARTLKGAQQILILGSGTGSSSAMEHLAAELKAHHPEIAKCIAGTVTVNEQHMSDDQLLAEARAFYAK
jgi:hypothetical protein